MGKWRYKKKSEMCTYRKRNKISNQSGLEIPENEKEEMNNKGNDNKKDSTNMTESKNKCRLCYKKEADKKGSHIVPHFLLKRIENIEGKTQRDYELGFRIGKIGMSPHFGRAVQPEKLEETFGKISDEDIAKNTHPLVVDNYFCSDCEKRFSLIENEYAKTINKIEDSKVYESGVSSLLGLLFWSSVIWRMSNHGKSGVKLKVVQEELLNRILDKYLPKDDIKELDLIDLDNYGYGDLSKISYKLIRFNDCDKEDSKFLIADPEYDNLFVLLIDEYILAFAFDNNYEDLKKTSKLGLEKLLDSVEKNGITGKEKIIPYPKDVYIEIQKKLVDITKDQYFAGINEFCDLIHKELGGKGDAMPQEIKNEIIQELASSEKKLGRKYTQEELKIAIMKVMDKYCR